VRQQFVEDAPFRRSASRRRSCFAGCVIVALAAITGARVAARGAAAVGAPNCQHASRETPAAGIDGDEERLRQPCGPSTARRPVGGGDEFAASPIRPGSGRARARTKIEPPRNSFMMPKCRSAPWARRRRFQDAGQVRRRDGALRQRCHEILKFTEDGDSQRLATLTGWM